MLTKRIAHMYYCWKFTIMLPRESVPHQCLCRPMSPLSLYLVASLKSSSFCLASLQTIRLPTQYKLYCRSIKTDTFFWTCTVLKADLVNECVSMPRNNYLHNSMHYLEECVDPHSVSTILTHQVLVIQHIQSCVTPIL